MAIELDRIGWEDAPSEQTPIDSGNLKQMENNAEKAINIVDKKISEKHELWTGGLHGSNEGEEVSGSLSGNVADYNFFICRVRKWSEAKEETTVVVSAIDKKQFFKLNSASKDYYAIFSITITSDNQVKFQCNDILGWQYKDNIQLEQVWGI